MKDIIEKQLQYHIEKETTYQKFQEVLSYAVMPPGKLFRPMLCCHFFADLCGQDNTLKELENSHSNLTLFSVALEIHHAYTLVHDDLPCMDDDDLRRGKESVHKKYGQWQAVLAGDALLHMSHKLKDKVNCEHKAALNALFNWSLGAKGLILGQVYDLGGEIKKDFNSLLRTHELKTGRLIQLALAGALILQTPSHKASLYTELKDCLRLGSAVGLMFQLLDDLCECCDDLSEHEQDVSPFLTFPELSLATVSSLTRTLQEQVKKLEHTSAYLNVYFNVIKATIENGQDKLKENLGSKFMEELLPVIRGL